jgi:hypothetical protein
MTQDQYLQKEVSEMLNQPYVLEVLTNDHRNELLRKADAYRAVRQVKKEPRVQAKLLKHLVAHLVGLLMNTVRQLSDQSSFFTDEAFTDGYR